MEEATIQITCPVCGCKQRVITVFPAWNKPFLPTIYKCKDCGEMLKVTDPHKYNEDGTIID